MFNAYHCLEVPLTSSYEEIRKAFSDKMKRLQNLEDSDQNQKMTLETLEAWKILKDEKSRKDFDLKLTQKSLENNQICSDFISIKDFENSIVDNHFCYDCRCGYEMDINVHHFENKPDSFKAYFECPICSS
ncbi:MAG: DnaJ subfamily C member 24, partial [Paramarteilia canceri]